MRGDSEKSTYLKIVGAKIVERLASFPTAEEASKVNVSDYGEKAHMRELKNDDGQYTKTIIERRDDWVEGVVKDIRFKDTDYGENLEILLTDGQDDFCLQMGMNSKYAYSFLMKAKNIDFTIPVKFIPWKFKDEFGRNGTTLLLDQRGEKVDIYFKGEARAELPAPPEWVKDVEDWKDLKFEQKQEYDLYKHNRTTALKRVITEEIVPNLNVNDLGFSEDTGDMVVETSSMEITPQSNPQPPGKTTTINVEPEDKEETQDIVVKDDDLPF